MADNAHGGSGGGSGASFANWASGILAIAVSVVLVIVVFNALLGPRVITFVPPGATVTTTAPRGVCTPEYTESVGGTSYFRLPAGC